MGVDRDDLKSDYPEWIEETFATLERACSWWCCRKIATVTMENGTNSAALPSDYIRLTSAKTPITIAPSGSTNTYMEATVVPREDLIRLESALLYPFAFSSNTARRSFPVYLQPSEEGLWFLKTLHTVSEDIVFEVSYVAQIPRLVDSEDENVITRKYPDLVKSMLKKIAFEEMDDPRAATWVEKSRLYLRDAIAVDEYERVTSQKFRMGGGSR